MILVRLDQVVEAEADAAVPQTPTAATVSFTFAHSKQFIGIRLLEPEAGSSLIADQRSPSCGLRHPPGTRIGSARNYLPHKLVTAA